MATIPVKTPDSKTISIDSGSSWMKVYDGFKKDVFPAFIRELSEDKLDGKEFKVGDKYYLIGHTALTSLNMVIKTPQIDADFHGSNRQYVQICYALERLGIRGAMDTLICSLPYIDTLKRPIKKKIKDRKKFSWGIYNEEKDAYEERTVNFNEIRIVPQGVGAMAYARSNDSKEPFDSAILIDVGSCTTDIVSIKTNKETENFDYVRDACTSIENANVTVFRDMWGRNLKSSIRAIDREHEWDFYDLMQHAMDNNFEIQIGDRKIDSKPSYMKTRDEFARELMPLIKKEAGDNYDKFNRIIFTGGGINVINFEVYKDTRISILDEWANVVGQFQMIVEIKAARKAAEQEEKTEPQQQAENAESV